VLKAQKHCGKLQESRQAAAFTGQDRGLNWPPMPHRFRVGQKVMLAPTVMQRQAAAGPYVVVRQLPERNGEFEYRIKSAAEAHERVARESELQHE
jgi:hypothetical protein